MRTLSLVLVVLLTSALLAEPVDDLVAKGRYAEILAMEPKTARDQAAWAFARFHLRPDKEVAKLAQAAHEAGDELWTYVLMKCHQTGTGLLRDGGQAAKLNFELRTRLEKEEEPDPLQLYLLSRCEPGDAEGRVRNPDAEKLFAEINAQRKLSFERLQKAADLGFAQALQDVALSQRSPDKAFGWHQKAADLGLAEGLRYAGIMLVQGVGTKKDAKKGLELTTAAAEAGDVYAMVNLAVFYHFGMGAVKDQQATEKWLKAAAESGHWYGHIEHGMAQITGDYGCKIDEQAGKKEMQLALESGVGDAFLFVGTAYAKEIIAGDGTQAVALSEAAYRQGASDAAGVLAGIYSQGLGSVKKDKEQARFWSQEAQKPGFGVQLLSDDEKKAFEARIKAIDPFALKLE